MNELKEEAAFFHAIAPMILARVRGDFSKQKTYVYRPEDKAKHNPATQTDIAIDNLIRIEINKRFPNDSILSEEMETSKQVLQKDRLWIIDPICGTINFSRGIKSFTTNIALAKDGKVIAGCVVDHSRGEYIWTSGEGKIYINDTLHTESKKSAGVLVELNLGALPYWNEEIKGTYTRFLSKLVIETNYNVISYATTLSFVYVALGRVDAYVSPYHHVWDVPAANFLIEQAGGIVTDFSGKPWCITSPNAVAARNSALHNKLLTLLRG